MCTFHLNGGGGLWLGGWCQLRVFPSAYLVFSHHCHALLHCETTGPDLRPSCLGHPACGLSLRLFRKGRFAQIDEKISRSLDARV